MWEGAFRTENVLIFFLPFWLLVTAPPVIYRDGAGATGPASPFFTYLDGFKTMSTYGTRPRSPLTTRHEGSASDFLDTWREDVENARSVAEMALKTLRSKLFEAISDERNLKAAFEHLDSHGGRAPGPDGRTYGDYNEDEAWELCRALRNSLRSGDYRRGLLRSVKIPKTGGGERTLELPNIADRVVARGMAQILAPVFEPTFSDCSFGFRAGRGRMHALAAAQHVTLREERLDWVIADIRNAFHQIPHARLADVLKKQLPERVVERALETSKRDGNRGVIQGGSLSPLLLNVYLNHFLDQPWRRDFRSAPKIRYADDILLCCRTHEEAEQAFQGLNQMLRAAGMPLKAGFANGLHNLASGVEVEWLGYRVARHSNEDRLRVQIGAHALRRLDDQLARAHERPNSPLVARETILGWLDENGPCYLDEDTNRVCREIQRMAAQHAFEEIPGTPTLLRRWRAAYERWIALVASCQTPCPAATPCPDH